MIYQSNSSFPSKVDPLIFFQDIDISQVPILTEYQKFVKREMYDDANEYIDSKDLHGYCAGLFNLIENRIDAAQKHLLTKQKVNPIIYQTTEPNDVIANYTIWDGKVSVDDK